MKKMILIIALSIAGLALSGCATTPTNCSGTDRATSGKQVCKAPERKPLFHERSRS